MIFPTVEDICDINREWILKYGGRYVEANNNFSNASSLEYILNAIQYPIYGVERFPSLIEKAAALAWWIIEGHVFIDGNKRTGMQTAIEFLEINGANTKFDPESIVTIAIEIASGIKSVKDLSVKLLDYVELPNIGNDK